MTPNRMRNQGSEARTQEAERVKAREVQALVERSQEQHLEAAELTDRLAVLTRPVPAPRATQRPVTPPRAFVRVTTVAEEYQEGDKVHITNRVGHADPVTAKDRAATITLVIGGPQQRVEFRTINNFHSWRAAKNLRRLTEEEFQAYREG